MRVPVWQDSPVKPGTQVHDAEPPSQVPPFSQGQAEAVLLVVSGTEITVFGTVMLVVPATAVAETVDAGTVVAGIVALVVAGTVMLVVSVSGIMKKNVFHGNSYHCILKPITKTLLSKNSSY